MAVAGRVYNITAYLPFHPGGVPELLRGAGMDATALFRQVHAWVNIESMLDKCFVGVLLPPEDGSDAGPGPGSKGGSSRLVVPQTAPASVCRGRATAASHALTH